MDPRQYRQSQPQRPSIPETSQTTSTAPSAFQSASSLSSISSIDAASAVPQTARLPPGAAPLPSPSAHQSISSQFPTMTSQTSDASQPPRRLHQQQPSSQYLGQRGDGRLPETTPFLQDFSLVAEAAKRAQIACLSRDLDEIGI